MQPLFASAAAASKRPRLRTPEAARYCGVSASLLNRLRVTGGGPAYSKISSIVCYDPDDLDLWLASKQRYSTSERRAR
jgi:hypothetical protein